MAGLGFFAGGLSDSLNQGFARNQQADYQQKELQLQQQGQQQSQQRFQQSQYMDLYKEGVQHMQDFFDQWKLAHPDGDIKQAAAAMAPTKDNLKSLLKNMGQDPNSVEALWASMIAAPSKAKTIQAEAEAKETPSLKAERASMAKYREYISDPFGLQGSSGTASPSGSNTFQQGTTLGPSTVEDIPPGAPLPIKGTQTAQATPAVTASGQGQKGDSFLSTLTAKTGNPSLANNVKAVGDYEVDLNTMLSRLPAAARQQFLGMVEQYNPDFDVKEYKGRSAAVQDFSKGPTARTVQSYNVLTSHLDTLAAASTALKNGDVKTLNALRNTFQDQFGQPAPNTFAGVRSIVGDELVKAITGGAGALGDREEIKNTINSASSPKQLADLIDKYQKLVGGQLDGLRKRYESTTGRKDFDRYLTPRAKQQFEGQGGASGTSSGVRWSIEP